MWQYISALPWQNGIFFFKQVHQVATDQVFETFSHLGHKKSLPALRNAAASGSSGQLESLANVFTQDAKRLQEVSELNTILFEPQGTRTLYQL